MPEPFTAHTGLAAILPIDNVDTDQIIPSREMKSVSRAGLSEGLFAGWRYLAPGTRDINPDFVLNRPSQTGTCILIAGRNFGCGSSREHAVWALAEYGIRAIVAKSFGDIFEGNCTRNGIVPVVLAAEDVDALHQQAAGQDITVDLREKTVSFGAWQRRFELEAFSTRLLLEGLDPISFTLKDRVAIESFQAKDKIERPWIYESPR